MTQERWTVTNTPIGEGLVDSQRWDEVSPIMVGDLTDEQAAYAVMLLNADAFGDTNRPGYHLIDLTDDIAVAVHYRPCDECGERRMQGTLDASKRCVECQS